jgi:hypothetical protein
MIEIKRKKESGIAKIKHTAKKNPPIWKKIVKFGSREKTTYAVVRE